MLFIKRNLDILGYIINIGKRQLWKIGNEKVDKRI